MKITLFGATGALGSECAAQAIEAGHQVTILARTPSNLPSDLANRFTVVQGDALNAADVDRAIGADCDAILFQQTEGVAAVARVDGRLLSLDAADEIPCPEPGFVMALAIGVGGIGSVGGRAGRAHRRA